MRHCRKFGREVVFGREVDFGVAEPKFGRVHLLPKIPKRLHSVPGRSVFCNAGFYTENISAFFRLAPEIYCGKSYVIHQGY